jgi:hypothetical protein
MCGIDVSSIETVPISAARNRLTHFDVFFETTLAVGCSNFCHFKVELRRKMWLGLIASGSMPTTKLVMTFIKPLEGVI